MVKKMEIRKPNKGEHRCTQTQCSYFRDGGCRKCSKCEADPFIINDNCETCFKCENVPNELRFDDPKAKKQSQAQTEVIDAVKNLANALNKLEREGKIEEKEPTPVVIKVIKNAK